MFLFACVDAMVDINDPKRNQKGPRHRLHPDGGWFPDYA